MQFIQYPLGKADAIHTISTTETLRNEDTTDLYFNLLKIFCYSFYICEIILGGIIILHVNDKEYNLFKFEAYILGVCSIILGIGNGFALYGMEKKEIQRTNSKTVFKKYQDKQLKYKKKL